MFYVSNSSLQRLRPWQNPSLHRIGESVHALQCHSACRPHSLHTGALSISYAGIVQSPRCILFVDHPFLQILRSRILNSHQRLSEGAVRLEHWFHPKRAAKAFYLLAHSLDVLEVDDLAVFIFILLCQLLSSARRVAKDPFDQGSRITIGLENRL